MAAEVLSCEEDKIEKALLEHKDFGKFFAFFKAKNVNVLLSNVVGKVLNALLETHADMVSKLRRFFLSRKAINQKNKTTTRTNNKPIKQAIEQTNKQSEQQTIRTINKQTKSKQPKQTTNTAW